MGPLRSTSLELAARVACVVALALTAAGVSASSAAAQAPSPTWAIDSAAAPTDFAPSASGQDSYELTVINVGEAASSGSITITDDLPAGVSATSIAGEDLGTEDALSCTLTPAPHCVEEGSEVTPGDVLAVRIDVDVEDSVVGPVTNFAKVSGGGASSATATASTPIEAASAAFGIESVMTARSSPQAAAHANFTASVTLNQVIEGGKAAPAGQLRALQMPVEEAFDASATPYCSVAELMSPGCSPQSAVGVVFAALGEHWYSSLVYNVDPSPSDPARFVFSLDGVDVLLEGSLEEGNGYQLLFEAKALPQQLDLRSISMTLWGVPASYDSVADGPDHVSDGAHFGDPREGLAAPLLTSGDVCDEPAGGGVVSAEPWSGPRAQLPFSENALSGCELLRFGPTMSVTPETQQANAPSGYEINIDVPQVEAVSDPAAASLKQASVVLPEGASLSLSAMSGLEACSEAEFAAYSTHPGFCPAAAQVGSFQARTPMLAAPLGGHVYLGTPLSRTAGTHLPIYLEASDEGITLKLTGEMLLNEEDGQIAVVLEGIPQLPVSELKLVFSGGPHALISNPSQCGASRSTAALTPWDGGPTATLSTDTAITDCAAGFAPSLQLQAQAGANGVYDAMITQVSRSAEEAPLSSLSLQMPAPVAEAIEAAQSCEAAKLGGCPASSEIGNLQVAAGYGPEPAHLSGAVYLTGPYEGASHGVAIELPASVGPLNLGKVLLGGSLTLEAAYGEATLQIGPLPIRLDGVPLQIDSLRLALAGAEVSAATSACGPFTLLDSVSSAEGGTASFEEALPATKCAVVGGGGQTPGAPTKGAPAPEGEQPTKAAPIGRRKSKHKHEGKRQHKKRKEKRQHSERKGKRKRKAKREQKQKQKRTKMRKRSSRT